MTDFEVFDKMSSGNMDITMCPDIISAEQLKKHGKVTFGVPLEAASKVINSMAGQQYGLNKERYYVAMYIINKKQFDELKQSSLNTTLK